MSYVHKKIHIFNEAGDVQPVGRKRSEGRLKTYSSAIDARVWSDDNEDRRQHILDLVKHGDGQSSSFGRYIPIEAIIEFLIANTKKNIEDLVKENEKLKKLLDEHNINYEEEPIEVIDLEEESVEEVITTSTAPGVLSVSPKNEVLKSSEEDGPKSPEDGPKSPEEEEEERKSSEEEERKSLEDAVKSSEEKITALQQALEESESFYTELATKAIRKLEDIRDIVEEKDAKRYFSTSSFKKKSTSDDRNNLRQRLDRLNDVECQVKKLRDKLKVVSAQAEDSNKEKECLALKIKELEKELDECKCNMKELEILRVEKNCMKMRLDDLSKVQQNYEELLKKTQDYESLKAEHTMYKTRCEELQSLECEVNELRKNSQRCQQLEEERKVLMKEVEDCECCMNLQEDEIKKLTCHIQCLTKDLDERQEEMKTKIVTMRAHIEQKDCLIAKSEQELEKVQHELCCSIDTLSCETSCLRNRIEELEDEVENYKKALAEIEQSCETTCLRNHIEELEEEIEDYQKALTDSKGDKCEIESLRKSIDELKSEIAKHQKNLADKGEECRCLEESRNALETSKKNLEANIKQLSESLESEKSNTQRLEEELKKTIKNDEHLKQMLKTAKCAIKCITQKLEKHDIVEPNQSEVVKEVLKKITNLEQ